MPTIIRAGAVAYPGTILISGAKKGAIKNRMPTIIDERPVLAPAEIPEADSIYVVIVLVPNREPNIVEIASEPRIFSIPEMFPFFFTSFASYAQAIMVPTESNRSTKRKEKITPIKLIFSACNIFSLKATGSIDGGVEI